MHSGKLKVLITTLLTTITIITIIIIIIIIIITIIIILPALNGEEIRSHELNTYILI